MLSFVPNSEVNNFPYSNSNQSDVYLNILNQDHANKNNNQAFTLSPFKNKLNNSLSINNNYENVNSKNLNQSIFINDLKNYKLVWRRLQLSRSKLKQTAKTSALFSGFAMVAMVELNFNNDPSNPIPPYLLILFGICTILLVGVHILALMIATCILPSVEAIALLESTESALESPHDRLKFFIELAWTLSSVIGVFLFLSEVIILFWVKFWEMGQPGKIAAFVSTFVFIPFVFIFIFFAIYFYRDFAKNKYEKSNKEIQELENMIVKLEKTDCFSFISNSPSTSKNELSDSKIRLSNNLCEKINFTKKNSKKKFNKLIYCKQTDQFRIPNDKLYLNHKNYKFNDSSIKNNIKINLNSNCDQNKIISPPLNKKLSNIVL